jgi:hypothetical protein
MDPLLDGMRERLEKAKARLAKAQLGFQAAQAEMQAAAGECSIWNSALSLVMRDEEKRLAESHEKQIPMNLPELQPTPSAEKATENGGPLQAAQAGAAINKTEKVREVLREHETGITPAGIWTEVQDHFSGRPYLYAVLKRLRDNDEVSIRRGKYQLKPKPVVMNLAETEATVI